MPDEDMFEQFRWCDPKYRAVNLHVPLTLKFATIDSYIDIVI